MSAPAYIGVDIGKSKLAVGVVGPDGAIHDWREASTPLAEGGPAILEKCASLVEQLLSHDGRVIRGIGVGASGVIDADRRVIVSSGSIPNWADIPLGTMFEERFGLTVSLENDVAAAALGEYRFGAAASAESSVYMVISTGVGFAWVWRSPGGSRQAILHRGAHDLSGQIAHLPLFGQNRTAVASFSGQGIAESGTRLLGYPVETRDVFAKASSGDEGARVIVRDAARAAATTVAWIQNTLDPDVIVLGGSVALRASGFVDAIRVELPAFFTRYKSRLPDGPSLVTSSLAERAGVVGAICPLLGP